MSKETELNTKVLGLENKRLVFEMIIVFLKNSSVVV